ncbi:hypothetical protein [Nocardia sp. NPDC052566]|uniref:hypothetical protein n=1 Tax=Nocardia sp. NPDC052566 TaxID=3364330 RepID=UPI0037C848F5
MTEYDPPGITNPENVDALTHKEIKEAFDVVAPSGSNDAADNWLRARTLLQDSTTEMVNAVRSAVNGHWTGDAADTAAGAVESYAVRAENLADLFAATAGTVTNTELAAVIAKSFIPPVVEVTADPKDAVAYDDQTRAAKTAEAEARQVMQQRYVIPFIDQDAKIPTFPPAVAAWSLPGTPGTPGIPGTKTAPGTGTSTSGSPGNAGTPGSENPGEQKKSDEKPTDGKPGEQKPGTTQPAATNPQPTTTSSLLDSGSQNTSRATTTTPATTTTTPGNVPAGVTTAAGTPGSRPTGPGPRPGSGVPSPGTPGTTGSPAPGSSRPALPGLLTPGATPAAASTVGPGATSGAAGSPGMYPPGARGVRDGDHEKKDKKVDLKHERNTEELLGRNKNVPPAIGE